jgi:hypothetical protein
MPTLTVPYSFRLLKLCWACISRKCKPFTTVYLVIKFANLVERFLRAKKDLKVLKLNLTTSHEVYLQYSLLRNNMADDAVFIAAD